MIVAMLGEASEENIQDVIERMVGLGFNVHRTTGAAQTILAGVGTPDHFDVAEFKVLTGVYDAYRITSPYKLAGRNFRPEGTKIRFSNGVVIGGDEVVMMAGPCSVESQPQLTGVAESVKAAGAHVLRGGAFKPRTSPYAFQGLEEDGLALLKEASKRTGLPVVTEVMEPDKVEVVAEHADILQIGARNVQNFSLLKRVAECGKPVLLKRGMSTSIQEWLLSAEYVLAGGNPNVILCERGIRTFETATRNTMDLNAVALTKRRSHLPVIADPSHGTGKWYLVPPLALASLAAGADGLIIEIHPDPDRAKSDGGQSLTLENFAALMPRLAAVAHTLGRKMG